MRNRGKWTGWSRWTNWRGWARAGALFGRGVTTATVAVVVALFAALLVAQGAARTSSTPNTQGAAIGSHSTQQNAFAAVGATATPVPTDTPTVLATATPVPLPTATVAPPAATPTPAPLPITLGCFSATAQSGNPGWYRYTTCVGAPAGASVNLTMWYCNGTAGPDAVSIPSIPTSGNYDAYWTRGPVGCAVPFDVHITATGTTADGQQLSGSASYTVR